MDHEGQTEKTNCLGLSDKTLDNIKSSWSLALVLFGMVVMTAATVKEENLFFSGVPWGVQIPFLVCDILLLGTLEGIQISLVALKNHNSEAFKESHPRAYKTNALCQKGRNLERFLMGRQVFVVITVFFGSYITTQSEDFEKMFGWAFPEWVGTAFFQTGLMGVLVVAIFGQLMPQVVASAYPINFMQVIPFVYPVFVGCLWFEEIGFVYLCYWVADTLMHVTGLKKKDDHSQPQLRKRGFSRVFRPSVMLSPLQRLRTMSRAMTRSRDSYSSNNTRSTNQLSKELGDVMMSLEMKNERDTEVIKQAMTKYPHLFNNFPAIVGGKVYSSPQQCAQYLRDNGQTTTPPFLTATSQPTHIPPHIYVARLLAEQRELIQLIESLPQDQAEDVMKSVHARGYGYGTEADSALLGACARVHTGSSTGVL